MIDPEMLRRVGRGRTYAARASPPDVTSLSAAKRRSSLIEQRLSIAIQEVEEDGVSGSSRRRRSTSSLRPKRRIVV